MSDTTFIYALVDPITKEPRYVGKSNNPKDRYYSHLTGYHTKSDGNKMRWIDDLRTHGLRPDLVILEEVLVSEWKEAERRWIQAYAEGGYAITNTAIAKNYWKRNQSKAAISGDNIAPQKKVKQNKQWVIVKVSKQLHKRIKLLAVQTDKKVEDTVEQLLVFALDGQPQQQPAQEA